VRRASILVEQLLDVPDSRFRADVQGGRQFLGWSEDRMIAASTRDHLVGLLIALSGAKFDVSDAWPRPVKREPEVIAPPTIADFDERAFMRWLMH
jgi:hypothetical protein